MIPASVLDNVVPWILQVLVIGSLGAVLPLMFRRYMRFRNPSGRRGPS